MIRLAFALLLLLQLPSIAFARGAPDSFADLVEAVMPAVVNISTSQNSQGNERQGVSLGSGFIVTEDGVVVTNNHVIDNADEILVILSDGTELPARLRASDPLTDIAVLDIDADRTFANVSFGDSDAARVGDWVVAIGNPFGLGGSVSAGIVSARNRDIDSGLYDDFIQTDAAINRGNSGGPLFDMSGRVIGVNTVIFSQTGGSVGVGFAVPSSLVQNVVDQLIEYGETQRGFLGVTLNEVDNRVARRLGLPDRRGALVVRPTPGGPSDKAGLLPDDVILRFGRAEIGERRDLTRAVAETPVGKTVPVTVLRGGERLTLEVTVDRRERALARAQGTPAISAGGLTLQAATEEVREAYGLPKDVAGVVVTAVDPSSPISQTLRQGDVILEIGWDEAREPADVARQLERLREVQADAVQILVQRGERLFYETIRP
ncbi:Do family serine endopeptidase [Parvularcula dongshanensis]|uniref:Probable periplasmic serine endoprotease DegP-like n=1 Tax=Parvularcula dongshanensis TaxID=1173995 RepID=A0A840I4Q6_9PROT|nr:Do family serine endopeptidase [Parvularcula dongshanensis]MBB4659158.1 serine protease Do [Parvularcula dongshanensis]